MDRYAGQQSPGARARARGARADLRGNMPEALQCYARAARLEPHDDSHRRTLWGAVKDAYGGDSRYPFEGFQLRSGDPAQACRDLAAHAAAVARREFLGGNARNCLEAGRVPWVFAALVFPESAEANATAAQALRIMDTWHSGAEPFLRRAAEQNRTNATHAYDLGTFYQDIGRPKKSLEAFRSAHERDPGNSKYRKTFEVAAARQDQAEKVQTQLRKCPHASKGARFEVLAQQHTVRFRYQEALAHLEIAIQSYAEANSQSPDNSVYRSQWEQALQAFVSNVCKMEMHDHASYVRGKDHARTLIGLDAGHKPLLEQLKKAHSQRWWRALWRKL